MVVSSNLDDSGGSQATKERPAASPNDKDGKSSERRRRRLRKTYVVRAGDTPGGIAERTGVPLETLEELNPDLDPQELSPGQRIKLRP
jgi:LysM repeat protein